MRQREKERERERERKRARVRENVQDVELETNHQNFKEWPENLEMFLMKCCSSKRDWVRVTTYALRLVGAIQHISPSDYWKAENIVFVKFLDLKRSVNLCWALLWQWTHSPTHTCVQTCTRAGTHTHVQAHTRAGTYTHACMHARTHTHTLFDNVQCISYLPRNCTSNFNVTLSTAMMIDTPTRVPQDLMSKPLQFKWATWR